MPPPDPRTDGELLEALHGGEAEAAGVLYDRHAGWAHTVARRYARDAAEADDAVHDAFAYLIRTRPRLHTGVRFTTLLFPMLRSAALTLRRRSARLKFGDAPGSDEDRHAGPLFDPGFPPPGMDESLARAVGALAEPMREVLLMRVVDEMGLEEIAAALAVPLGTVKSRLHRAMAEVRATYKDDGVTG